MPKMKTKSSCKMRFKATKSGKLKRKNAGKRHMMENKKGSTIRRNRLVDFIFPGDAHFIKKYFMPYVAKRKKK